VEENLVELLKSLRKNEITLESFSVAIEELLKKGLLTHINVKKRGRVSEFINYLDSFDASIPGCESFFDRLKMARKRANGQYAYPRAQVIEEAFELERYLLGEETRFRSFLRFFSILR